MKYKKVPVPEEFDFYRHPSASSNLLSRNTREETNENYESSYNFCHDDPNPNYTEPVLDIKQGLDAGKISFIDSIKSKTIEKNYPERLKYADCLMKASLRLSDEELLNAKNTYEQEAPILRSTRKAQDLTKVGVKEYLKNYTVDEWILLVTRLYKGITNLLRMIELDVENIVINTQKMVDRGVSTIRQLEMLMKYNDQKIELLNVYCLNKMFAGLLVDDYEREIFLVVMQRKKQVKQIESQKLRTAYRKRRQILKRLREFCIVHGMDRFWFFEHFASLPIVQYYAKHHDYDKKTEELRLDL